MPNPQPPKTIYLQLHGEWDGETDVITWCEDKINEDDPEYILNDPDRQTEGTTMPDSQSPEKIHLHRCGIWNEVIIWNENKEDDDDVPYIREGIYVFQRALLYELASHANALARELELWKSDNDHAERVINLSTDALSLLSNEVLEDMHKDNFNPPDDNE